MRKPISNVLQNYLNRLSAKRDGSLDATAILETIPDFFKSAVTERINEFKIYGSIGQGNAADVPWVSILHKDVTETTQEGIYIVLLFASDMSGCYLSLNQGVTDFEKRFKGKKKILEELKKSSLSFQERLPKPLKGILDPIDLKTKQNLGTYYNFGNIQAFYYPKEKLPTAEELKKDFVTLLASYDHIIKSGATQPSEEEFQLFINECASKDIKRSDITTSQPIKQRQSVEKFKRNLRASAFAIQDAAFTCEINRAHKTFTSKSTGNNYVEAHHLIPLSCQTQFEMNLDIPENIVSLCPNCHKLLHLGSDVEKQNSLRALYKERESKLKEFNIDITEDELLDFYK